MWVTCMAVVAGMGPRRPARSFAVNPMPEMGAMFHPFRSRGSEKGLCAPGQGHVAHHPCPQTRLTLRDLTVILIASVIESQHEGAFARLSREKVRGCGAGGICQVFADLNTFCIRLVPQSESLGQ